jgi:hypothetical protein
MDRVVLITDIDTALGLSLLETYHRNGVKALGISSAEKKIKSFPEFGKDELEIFEWRRYSPIDAKNVIIEVLKKYKTIDEALVVQSVSASGTILPDIDIALIDKTVDYWVKGNLYLTREILSFFSKVKKGILAFIDHRPINENEKSSPLEESVRSAFSGIIGSLLPCYLGKEVFINGFESTSANELNFAQFVYKNMNERFRNVSGKLVTYHESKGIFGNFKR